MQPVRQKTLKSAISCSGVGLHSGERTSITLHPAEIGSGIVFRRRGAANGGVIRATYCNVVRTTMCTTLGNREGATVATVEHLMAAFAGCEIDNAIVEIDGSEVPVMDGSAAPFVSLIDCAGIVEQSAPRAAIQVIKPIGVSDGQRMASLAPADGFLVSFEIHDRPPIDRQDGCFEVTGNTFRNEIASARTYGFVEEIETLRANGLARGGSLDNAVVVSGSRILNDGGLRFPDEFVRHKVLDSIGDLYLAGAPLIGHFHGRASGHAVNVDLLRALFADPTAWRRIEGGQAGAPTTAWPAAMVAVPA